MTGQPARPRVYLDHNATAPLRPEARAAALSAMDLPSNASSVHAEGRRARAILDLARGRVGALVGASADGVVFTSGATEAAHLALTPDLAADGSAGFPRLLVSATEHLAVLRGHRFPAEAVTVLPVSGDGTLDLAALEEALASGPRAVVAVQAANNETGVLQPIAAIGDAVRRHGGLLVCDAVQAAGRIDCRGLGRMSGKAPRHPAAFSLRHEPVGAGEPTQAGSGADIVLLSGHKLGGLAGAGALVVMSDRIALGAPVLCGGGQERGRRSGTENVAAIAAFGAASAAVAAAGASDLSRLRDRFEAALTDLAPDAVVFGCGAPRLPNTCAFAVPGVAADRLLMSFDLDGVAVSSGSACASGKVGRSHVLDAMKVKTIFTSGAIRVSFGWDSAEADVDRVVHALATALHRMREGRRRAAA